MVTISISFSSKLFGSARVLKDSSYNLRNDENTFHGLGCGILSRRICYNWKLLLMHRPPGRGDKKLDIFFFNINNSIKMYVGPIYKGKFDLLVRCTVQSPLTSLVSILNLMTKKGVTKEQYPFTNVSCMYQKPRPN